MQGRNRRILDASSGNIAVVLDGRAGTTTSKGTTRIQQTEGYLGDAVEAAMVANELVDQGLNVTIYTPHLGTLSGDPDRNVSVNEIPIDMTHYPNYPWSHDLIRHIAHQTPNTPVFFPLNGQTPLFIQPNRDGTIANQDDIDYLQRATHGEVGDNMVLDNHVWHKRGVHQLQALQANLDLLGLDVSSWDRLPPAYLNPSPQARQNAQALASELLPNTSGDKIPLYVHIGVATGGIKVKAKYFPIDLWKETFDVMRERNLPISSIVFFIPSDEDQAKDTVEVLEYAGMHGLPTVAMPERAAASRYGWSFGTFVGFLQELSKRNGMVLGCDSMPVHAAAATGNRTVVIGNKTFSPIFYAPRDATIALPKGTNNFTRNVRPHQVVAAMEHELSISR